MSEREHTQFWCYYTRCVSTCYSNNVRVRYCCDFLFGRGLFYPMCACVSSPSSSHHFIRMQTNKSRQASVDLSAIENKTLLQSDSAAWISTDMIVDRWMCELMNVFARNIHVIHHLISFFLPLTLSCWLHFIDTKFLSTRKKVSF